MKRLLALFMAAIGLAAGSFAEMLDLSTVTDDRTIPDGTTLIGTLHGNRILSIAANATVTLSGVIIEQEYVEDTETTNRGRAGLQCLGNATIILEGANTVEALKLGWSGIYVLEGSTLTIQGNGSLTAVGKNGAGIGGADRRSCGNIVIKGGTINAIGNEGSAGIGTGEGISYTNNCGYITIEGGTVRATGGRYAPGIGSGWFKSNCGDITIKGGNTHVYATPGEECSDPIGAGPGYFEEMSTCGNIITTGMLDYDGDTREIYSWDGDLSNVYDDVTAWDGTTIHGTYSGYDKIAIADGANVTLYGATIENYDCAGIVCLGSATITLVGHNEVASWTTDSPGICVPGGATVTIKAKWSGSHGLLSLGSLWVNGGDEAAGIGGGTDDACGNIVIEGGTITAEGGANGGAGIGSGACDKTGGSVVISGGTVTATGTASGAAGIGAGGGGYVFNEIRITGGTVDAKGGMFAPGIGSTSRGYCGNITITPGVTLVQAEKGNSFSYGPISTGVSSDSGITVPTSADGFNDEVDGNVRRIYPTPWDGNLADVTGAVVATDGMTIYGTLNGAYKVSIASGATVTLSNVRINGGSDYANRFAGITCLGDATIILEGTSYVKSFYFFDPGIHVPEGSTLVIKGNGSLTATASNWGSGIGGGYYISCGNIVIEGGTITASGGWYGVGIGGGFRPSGDPITCGNITIGEGVTSVTATRGDGCAVDPIGAGTGCSNESEVEVTVAEGLINSLSLDGKTRTIARWNGDLAMLQAGDDVIAFDGTVIRNTLGSKAKVSIADGATVILSNAVINVSGVSNDESCKWAGLTCLGSAQIVLQGESTINGFYRNNPGIFVPEGSTLRIKDIADYYDTDFGYAYEGVLTVRCGGGNSGYAAGIGAGPNGSCGDIVVQSGTVNAYGGENSAGIGGAYGATCGNIYIYGGEVNAYGTYLGPGIGGGRNGTCGRILIDGGTVRAEGGDGSAGIGGPGCPCEGVEVTVSTISLTAVSGNSEKAPIESIGTTITVMDGLVDRTTVITTGSSSKNVRTISRWDGDLGSLADDMVIPDGMVVYGTLGGKYKVSIAADAYVTLSNAVINIDNVGNDETCKWAGLTCLGSATINLEGTNTIKGFYRDYPGIYVPSDDGVYVCGLDIEGDGKLTASSGGYVAGGTSGHAAGIGGGKDLDCGSIQIWSGTIVANGGFQGGSGIGGGYASRTSSVQCGEIIIYGGTITATGGWGSAGIGGGEDCYLGQIIIDGGSVTATHGNNCENAIGAGSGGSCPRVDVSELLVDDHGNPTRTIAPWDGNLSLLDGTGEVTALNGTVIRGTLASGVNYKINIADGAEVVLRDATITGGFHAEAAYEHAGLTCLGDATIVLEGANTVKGFHNNYSAIYVPEGCTLVIDGDGALTADVSSTSNYAAAIGGGRFQNCGDIDIEGGTITALGGYYGVGIGGAYRDSTGSVPVTCGDITIGEGIVSVTATRGAGCTEDPIGPGKNCSNSSEVDVNVANGLNKSFAGNTRTIWRWDGNLATLTKDAIAADGTVIYGTLAANVQVSIAADATVTLSNAVINSEGNLTGDWAGLTCLGSAEIVLADGSVSTIKGFHASDNYPGIYVPEDDGNTSCTLTISGTGTLNAICGGDAAGIGGARNLSCGDIVIDGGTINARGGYGCAGIGAGWQNQSSVSCGEITINGGTITAKGGTCAAGIGTGMGSSCCEIFINGGKVTAQGGDSGAGIGGGLSGEFMNILIYGGDVVVTGGVNAAGIGTGKNGEGWSIVVDPGIIRVVATRGEYGVNAIGAGADGSCEEPQINTPYDDHGDPTRTITGSGASSGYATWAADNHIEGDWDDVDSYGIANVIRYVFDTPSGSTVDTITNIAINAAGKAVVYTAKLKNTSGFTVVILASDEPGSYVNTAIFPIAEGGVTTINEPRRAKRFFSLLFREVGDDSIPGQVVREKVQLWANGPYWATTNIGAEKPEDSGYYFWWGDTVGYTYDSANSQWVSSTDGTTVLSGGFSSDNCGTYGGTYDISSLTSEGWITAGGVLAPEHDAATQHWGGDWRMPTYDEIQTLVENCKWTWTTQNGVNGYFVTGQNEYASNRIFLPASGFGDETSLMDRDFGSNDFFCWSSVPSSDDDGSWSIIGGSFLGSSDRSHGFPIRPVQGYSN